MTIDFGIRWEFNPVPGAADGKYPLALTTGNLAMAQLAPQGTPQYHTSYDNFAPRFGFAYQINSLQSHPLVVRGGFGVFYDTGQNFGSAGYTGYPFIDFNVLSNVTLPAQQSELQPPPLNSPLVQPYGPLLLNDPALRLPYTEQWNLSVSQGLSSRNTLTVSYVGNGGRKLIYVQQFYDASSINPAFSELSVTRNGASSAYNSLQVQDQGYIAPGMQLIASYTWAHAIDDVTSDTPVIPLLRGNSDNDIRNLFNLALNYQPPGVSANRLVRSVSRGWALNTRFTAQSGIPLDVFQDEYFIEPGSTVDIVRPDLARNVPSVLHNAGDPFEWALNPAAFLPIPVNPDGSPTRQGTLPRNYIHGPGFWNLTLAAQREFPIKEQLRLLFRVEAFNLFNHPNAGMPDVCLCDGTSFGIIGANTSTHGVGVPNPLYATGSPRSLQLALKLLF
jgi:hypothetical protein